MRRVVVTGLGIVSPLGRGVAHNWKSLLEGKSGIRKIEGVDLKDIPVTIAGVWLQEPMRLMMPDGMWKKLPKKKNVASG